MQLVYMKQCVSALTVYRGGTSSFCKGKTRLITCTVLHVEASTHSILSNINNPKWFLSAAIHS